MITERFLTDPAECQYNIWRSASQSWLHLDCWLGNISQASPEFPFLFDWKIRSILGIVIPYWYATLCSNGPPSWRWRRSTLTRWQSCCQTLAGSSQTPSGGNWTSDRQEQAWTGSWCWKYNDIINLHIHLYIYNKIKKTVGDTLYIQRKRENEITFMNCMSTERQSRYWS